MANPARKPITLPPARPGTNIIRFLPIGDLLNGEESLLNQTPAEYLASPNTAAYETSASGEWTTYYMSAGLAAVNPKLLDPARIEAAEHNPVMNEATLKARASLLAAGLLATDLGISDDEIETVSDEELEQLGAMLPGARPSEEIVAEDRGE